jgi:carbon storage regulator
MLVLSRRETERVRLGDSIVLTIVRVSGDKVRLGIEAPPNVLVLRDELQPHSSQENLIGSESSDMTQAKAA